MDDRFETCVVFLLGYPGVGKRSVGSQLAELLDGVLVDNQLINIPLLTLFKWDGEFRLPEEIWERVGPIREAVLGTIEDLAPKSNSYVFTNVLQNDEDGMRQYDRIRSLAQRRGSLFLSAMLDCDVEEQVRRIDAIVPTASTAPVPTTMALPPNLPPNLPQGAGPLVIVYGPGEPSGPTTTTIPRRAAPPGVTTHGSGDMGWSKVTTSGSITVDFRLYPADVYLDEALQVSAGVSFTGAARAIRLDWGDGTSYIRPADTWHSTPCTIPATRYEQRWLLGNQTHTYAAPGTYTVTATITIADCTPPPELTGLRTAPPIILPNGQPMGPPEYPPMGNDTVVTVSLPAKVHPEAQPRVVHINYGPG